MKNNSTLDHDFWNAHYQNNDLKWDLGSVSPPIKQYIDQLDNKSKKILIPGAGNAYEAAYLFENNYLNTTVIDLVKAPLINLSNRVPAFPDNQLIQTDFFKHQGCYDLIIEHTFFCALQPSLRVSYMNKMADLLPAGGKLVGLLFNFELTSEGPPFGGAADEYIKLFSTKFNIITLETCYNSIKPRAEKELFFIFEKK